MDNRFFERPILNSPYEDPKRHWELDVQGQPTQQIIETRRKAEFITPIPKPRKRKGRGDQQDLVFDEGKGLSTEKQQYEKTSAIINELRHHVEQWRRWPNPNEWQVTPETARLLQHWRHHQFSGIRPFFCQIEAVETLIWLTEVAPKSKTGKAFLEHLANANAEANPELMRLALKLATGAGKTTVMAMIIAWQTTNAVRRPGSGKFTRGFLVISPGLTIRDRLRVLQPNDPDIRGRSSNLRINYRTSHQIRTQADRLLGPEVSDVDGNTEQRNATVSLFNGPPPEVLVFDSPEDEIQSVSQWLAARTKAGVLAHEIGVFVRSAAQLDRAQAAISGAGLPFKLLDDTIETASRHVALGAMHLAKGLEFRAVAVMACDDEIIPLQERIESVTDDADLEEVYNTERHLLYVACTRARDNLLVTSAAPASEFLDDLRG